LVGTLFWKISDAFSKVFQSVNSRRALLATDRKILGHPLFAAHGIEIF
jgi:hypothetical protein